MRTARCARLGVVGLGRIGRIHAHNVATCVQTAELAAVVDACEPIAREVGDRYGVPWTTSLEALLGDPSLDGVVIATPSSSHPELVELAAAAGRHVFCEKPVGLDPGSCSEAVAAAEAAGVALQVGFQRRFDPDWRALGAALAGGEIGELRLFRCSHRNARPPDAGAALGDVFADVAVHDLDTARWLGGEIVELFAAGAPGGAGVALTLRFDDGAIGLVDAHRSASYGFECSAELVGSAATIRCGYSARSRGVELLRAGRASAPLACDHAERHAAAYAAELEHFGDVAGARAEPLVDGRDALAALRLAALAARSAAAGAPLAVEGHAAGML